MIEIILSVINFIAIVVMYILFFTRNSKEKFTGVPSGYTNLVVSDPDGNLDTFSLATLENDINTIVANALKAYTPTSTLEAKYQPKGNYQPAGNYVERGGKIMLTGTWPGMGGSGPNVCRTLLGAKSPDSSDDIPGTPYKYDIVYAGHGGTSGGCALDGADYFNEWVVT